MRQVGYLFDKSASPSPEEHAAWDYLSSSKSIKSTRISFKSLNRQPTISKLPDILWWHFDSSKELPKSALNPQVISTVRKFVQEGGSLFLSLLASPYVVNLGLEETTPNVVSKGLWNEENWAPEYPDIRGFATYLGHPIFQGLPGGVYVWNPSKGDDFCASFYEGIAPARGDVVAVDRQYIRINEQRRIICEYRVGKGRILTIGTYFFFKERHHRFRPHLDKFALNCLSYLSGPSVSAKTKRTYWNFDPRTVTQAIRTGGKTLKTAAMVIHSDSEEQVIRRELGSVTESDQFYDVGGKRILIAGSQRGGISEIWCHPVRVARNLRIAFRVGDGAFHWTHDLQPQFIAKPECIVRTYAIGAAIIEEIVFGDRKLPCGAIHFRINSLEPVEIVMTASVDLRMMWPLSDEATGSLTYAWDDNLKAVVVTSPHSHCSAMIGSSDPPVDRLAGQFSEIEVAGRGFAGKSTNAITVALAMQYRLSGDDKEMTLFISGSHLGEGEAERAYRAIVGNPRTAMKRQSAYYRNLLGRCTQIQTPNPEVNDAYRWALTSTDRFHAEVPGLGASLFAGYGTTERGWNGGHMNSGRPGYTWFFGRDSVWTCFAFLGYGDFSKVKDVLDFLGSHQDPAGKIPHELTTSGFAHYDAADSTPLYIILMGKYLSASGDIKFVRDQYDRLLKAMEFCFSTDTDHDHLIENTNVGHGWVEGGQLFPVHCEHYLATCWAKALEEASEIASLLRKRTLANKWSAESKRVSRIVEKEFWNERTQFYNFAKPGDGKYNEEKTLLPAVGISFGYGAADHARKCLEAYASDNFSADWGTRIIGKDDPMFKPTGYHCGSIWPLFTGWASLAEFKAGRPIQGFAHAMSNLLLYNRFAAGTIEEVFHGEIFQPAGVCSHQAWSESMAIQPILDGMMGLKPDATTDRLSLRPYFPPDWNSAELKNIPLGDRRIDFSMNRSASVTKFEFQLTRGKPAIITLQPYFSLGTRLLEIKANGKTNRTTKIMKRYDDSPTITFSLTKKSVIEFKHSCGVALVPPVPRPAPMQQSTGLRVIGESWEREKYVLALEGKSGQSYSIDLIDPDTIIRSVNGGRILKRDGVRVTASIEFEESTKLGSYSKKEISFRTS